MQDNSVTKRLHLSLIILAASLVATPATAQNHYPHIGYVYPAGGQAGSTVQVVVGGMNLAGINAGMLSGDGTEVTSVRFFQPFPRLSPDARRELLPMMWAVANRRDPVRTSTFFARRTLNRLSTDKGDTSAESDVPNIVPGERLVYLDMTPEQVAEKLKALSPLEFACLHKMLTARPNSLQANPAIEQIAIVEVQIAAEAVSGMRELRLISPNGITNPLLFEVADLPEITETPQYGRQQETTVQRVTPPALLNGQILPGEVDIIEFDADKGQAYIFELLGRNLAPFLGDAVPGWFQPVLSVHDPDSAQMVAFADDNRFDPDPVLTFTAVRNGKYQLHVRDSIYRGREDFVYRIKAYAGEPQQKNVPVMRWTLPRQDEHEPNNKVEQAEPVVWPKVVAGAIAEKNDVDVFKFEGKKGMRLAAEVMARRMDSPMDSLLRLTDSSGTVLAWNDDGNGLNVGIKTHHADSAFNFELPEDGTYFVHVSDAQNKSGPENAYFLRLGEAAPDFQVYMDPSALNARAGDHVPVTFHVLRQDGLNGPIDVYVKDGPQGLDIGGGRIPAGATNHRATLAVPPQLQNGTHPFRLEAAAGQGNTQIIHEVVAVDEVMQAFLWLHLVPAKQSLIHVNRRNWAPFLPIDQAVQLRPEAQKTIKLKTARPLVRLMAQAALSFALNSPPRGITLITSGVENNTVFLTLETADDIKEWEGNLIVDCFVTREFKTKDGKTRRNTSLLGSLPAIPVKVSH